MIYDPDVIEKDVLKDSFYSSNRGKILCGLGRLLIDDYRSISKRRRVAIGDEDRDTANHIGVPGLIIAYNCNLRKGAYDRLQKNDFDGEVDLEQVSFADAIAPVLHKDLGVIIEDNIVVSNGILFNVLKDVIQEYNMEPHELIERYFFKDKRGTDVGTRITNALAVSLYSKETCYAKCQTAINETGCGRVIQFGREGIRHDLFLDFVEDKGSLLKAEDYLDYKKRVVLVSREFVYNPHEQRINIAREYIMQPRLVKELASMPLTKADKNHQGPTIMDDILRMIRAIWP